MVVAVGSADSVVAGFARSAVVEAGDTEPSEAAAIAAGGAGAHIAASTMARHITTRLIITMAADVRHYIERRSEQAVRTGGTSTISASGTSSPSAFAGAGELRPWT